MLAEAPFNTLTREIIGGAIEVHRALGPGLLETPCPDRMPCRLVDQLQRGEAD
jgi:hypothetical protein